MTAPDRRSFDPQHLSTGVLALSLLAHWWRPVALMPPVPSRLLGAVLLAGGVVVARRAATRFLRARTTLDPSGSSAALVTDGPYRRSRNPIYVAYVLVYAGVACLVDSLWPFPALLLVVLYLDRVVIPREEARLESTFGADYRAYRARVRRWL